MYVHVELHAIELHFRGAHLVVEGDVQNVGAAEARVPLDSGEVALAAVVVQHLRAVILLTCATGTPGEEEGQGGSCG